jgi:thiamine transport system substrate-binding protein
VHSHKVDRTVRKLCGAGGKAFARVLGLFILLPILAGCQILNPQGKHTLTVMTHDSFAVSDSVLKHFEQSTGVQVAVLKSGDAGEMLNKAILTKAAPLADVLYGVDNTLLTRALQEGIYVPYASPALASIPAEFQLDAQNRALPVDHGYVCVNYDITWFASRGLAAPKTFEDLARPEYQRLLVVENPLTSSPGFDFLLATIARFGTNGYLEYWKTLKADGVAIVDGWETAYYTNFSGSSGKGPQPMVVSYSTDPAYEMMNADPPISAPPLAALDGPEMCFHQIEFVGILAGTHNRAAAEQFVDFMLSSAFQEDVPLQMSMYPVKTGAALPEAFTKFAPIPAQPAILAPEEITAHREEWMNAWKELMLP